MQHSLIRIADVLAAFPIKRTKLYLDIRAGEFLPPLKPGHRSSFWVKSEVEAFLAGLTAGKAPKTLVTEILAARVQA